MDELDKRDVRDEWEEEVRDELEKYERDELNKLDKLDELDELDVRDELERDERNELDVRDELEKEVRDKRDESDELDEFDRERWEEEEWDEWDEWEERVSGGTATGFWEEHKPPRTVDDIFRAVRYQLNRWCRECPVCVLAGRDRWHRTTTADCPLARREDIEYVESLASNITPSTSAGCCKFCLMPEEACLKGLTRKPCDQSSWRRILEILAGLVRAKGPLLSSYVALRSGESDTPFFIFPMEESGRNVYLITLEINYLSRDFQAQEKASWRFRYEVNPRNDSTQRGRLMQCLRIGLSRLCVCEDRDHRLSYCICEYGYIGEDIHNLSGKLRFNGKEICRTSGMPKEACGCTYTCRYNRYSGLDAIYCLLLQERGAEEKWKDKWKMDDNEIMKELSKTVYVGGRQYSRLAVEIANLYGANFDGTDIRERP